MLSSELTPRTTADKLAREGDRALFVRIVIVDDSGLRASVLEEGLRKERAKPILDLAIRRFNAFARMQAELDEARTALSDRKTIDRAKTILMQSRGLAEPDAYALLRSTAMNQNRRIVDVAEALITAHSLLGGQP